jgi:DNA-binding NarL/FixJ family response regulator
MDAIKDRAAAFPHSPQHKTWRGVIVDDHPIFRRGLRELLETVADVEVCAEAQDEDTGIGAFINNGANFATVDISLSAGHGLNLVSRMKKANPAAVVLVISMFDDRVYAERALAAGASGYVCKQCEGSELINALKTVSNGKLYVNESILQELIRRRASAPRTDRLADHAQLSGRELQIFTLIGQGRTTHQIADELKLAVSTVETYRERLKSKLKLASGAELTRHAILWLMQNV